MKVFKKDVIFFRLILPILYVYIQWVVIRCGEGSDGWELCGKDQTVYMKLYELSYQMNPFSWLSLLLGRLSEYIYTMTHLEVIFIFSAVILFICMYVFGIWWYYFIGKILDSIVQKTVMHIASRIVKRT
jgi:hypothetical protein